jgi:two-component system, sensor histidine kinase and response regulator
MNSLNINDFIIAFDSVNHSIAILSPINDGSQTITDFRFLYINSCAEALMGLSKENVLNKGVAEIFPGVIEEGVLDRYRRVITSGITESNEFHYKHEHFDHYFLQTVKKAGNNLVIQTEDISQKRQMEINLLEQNEILKKPLTLSKTGYFIWTPSGHFWSEEMMKIFNLKSPEFFDFLKTKNPSETNAMAETIKTEEGHHQFEYVFAGSQRSPYIYCESITEMNSSGSLSKIEGFVQDISQRKQIEEQQNNLLDKINAEKILNQKKNEFISIASHELKTPLTSLKAYLQLLDKLISEDLKTEKSYLLKSQIYVLKLENLISDLLDVSKIESGKLLYNFEKVEFSSLINECVESLRPMNGKHKIILKNVPDNIWVVCDKQRLEQVLDNLISNGAKYSPHAQTLEVSINNTGNEIVVGVKDYGIGIKSEYKQRIFEKFFRAEDTNSSIKGLGIGLYISSEIIKQHGGKIWFNSEFGSGTEFYFSIPTAVN